MRKSHNFNCNMIKSELILFDFECWFAICLYFLKIHCWVSCSVSNIGHIDCHETRSTMFDCSLRQAKTGWVYGDQNRLLQKSKDMAMKKRFPPILLAINSLVLPFVYICLFVVSGVYFWCFNSAHQIRLATYIINTTNNIRRTATKTYDFSHAIFRS